jgi:hypothetical protein
MASEQKDAKPKWVLVGAVLMWALLVLPCVTLALIYGPKVRLTNFTVHELSTRFFPAPPLGPFDSQTIAQLRKKEEQDLSSYHWQNKAHSEAQVPVDRAMQIYLQNQTRGRNDQR